jgi:hypothetical protein
MTSRINLSLIFCLYSIVAFSQSISINATGVAPHSSAMLDIQSDSKGLLVPRMSTSNRMAITTPATGLIVYDLDKNRFYCFAGNEWVEVMAGFSTILSDQDQDTKVEVEQAPDEDIIRFTIDSVEQWVMTGPRLEPGNPEGAIYIGLSAGLNDSLIDSGNIAIGRGAMEHNSINPGIVAIGDSALHFSGLDAPAWFIGDNNTAVGAKSLLHTNRGDDNTAVGAYTMYKNVWGSLNAAIGANALYGNDGDYNTAAGGFAMYNNEDGRFNTAAGFNSLYNNIDGDKNTALGSYAMRDNTNGINNTAIGYLSLLNNTIGNLNVTTGFGSMLLNETGSQNTANGESALYSNVTGNRNTAIGTHAMYSNDAGNSNTAVGEKAMYSNTEGHSNISIGTHALFHNTTQSNLVAIGDSALFNIGNGATSSLHGRKNTAIGSKAMYSTTTGFLNTSIGEKSMYSNVSGFQNTAIGQLTMYSAKDGISNTALGNEAMYSDTSGINNVALGFKALYSQIDANNNTAVGSYAMFKDSSGFSNTAVGRSSLYQNKSGTTNVAIGGNALSSITAGSRNIGIGYSAGSGTVLHTKSGGIYIGYYAGYSETADNRLYIENSSSDTPLIYGEFDNNILTVNGQLGIGTKTPIGSLHVVGGDDTDLVSGGYIMLGSPGNRSIAIDDNEIQARDDSLASILYLQAEGGDFSIHHPNSESTQFVVKENGKAGIGVTLPTDKLHINAESGVNPFRVQLNGDTKFRIHDSGGISLLANSDPGANSIHIETGSSDFRIEDEMWGPTLRPTTTATGSIGLPTLRFAHMYSAFFDGTLVSPSDLRFKENILHIEQPGEIIKSLSGKKYAFTKEHYYQGRMVKDEFRRTNQFGLIAQEVEAVLPQLVHTNAKTGMKSVEYIGVIPILIEAMKEQQVMIERLQKENTMILSQMKVFLSNQTRTKENEGIGKDKVGKTDDLD